MVSLQNVLPFETFVIQWIHLATTTRFRRRDLMGVAIPKDPQWQLVVWDRRVLSVILKREV